MDIEEFKTTIRKTLTERKEPINQDIFIRKAWLVVQMPTRSIMISAKATTDNMSMDFEVEIKSTESDLVNNFHDEEEKMAALAKRLKDLGLNGFVALLKGEFAIKMPVLEYIYNEGYRTDFAGHAIGIIEVVQEQLSEDKRVIQSASVQFVEQQLRAFKVQLVGPLVAS